MRERPKQLIAPSRPGAGETGEVGSEGGSPGDMLLPQVKPAGGAAGKEPAGVTSLLWWVVLVPVVVVLLWFATSLGSR